MVAQPRRSAGAPCLRRLRDKPRAPRGSDRSGLTVGSVHATVLLLAALAAAAPGPRLAAPVDGAITEGFSYAGDPFAPGHHRGVDLAAAPGAPVRAACAGRVTFAARAGANGVAVTVRCGAWSVTHLPLRRAAVRA